MKPPFDIAADLDTPVSAYLKLAPFKPRFLLESVEGGERLARYSFIGFGDCLEVRLDSGGLNVGGIHTPRRAPRRNFWQSCAVPGTGSAASAGDSRRAVARRLVGYTAYDAVRYFERVPGRSLDTTETPHAHYVAPRSLLVFDHLTRGVALLHDGSEAERQSLRREVVQALRGAVPTIVAPGPGRGFSPATPSLSEAAHAAGVRRAQEYIASGDVYQLVLASRFEGLHSLSPFEVYRALRLLNPSPYMYFANWATSRWWDLRPRRWSNRTAAMRSCGRSPDRGPGARTRPRCRTRGGIARRSEGECRARHARRSREERSGPRRHRRFRQGESVPCDRALQPHHAYGQRRARRPRTGPGRLRFGSPPPFRPARWWVRPRCARWKSSTS